MLHDKYICTLMTVSTIVLLRTLHGHMVVLFKNLFNIQVGFRHLCRVFKFVVKTVKAERYISKVNNLYKKIML